MAKSYRGSANYAPPCITIMGKIGDGNETVSSYVTSVRARFSKVNSAVN